MDWLGLLVWIVSLVLLVVVCNFLGAGVLSVFAGAAGVLNGEFGAVVEAGEAEFAVLASPGGTAIAERDDVVGTEVGAKATANAVGIDGEMLGSRSPIKGIHGDGGQAALATVGVVVARFACSDAGDNLIDFAFGSFQHGIGLGTVATFIKGAEGVGHEHRVVGIDRAAESFLEEAYGIARGATGGEDGVGVVPALDLQLLCKA